MPVAHDVWSAGCLTAEARQLARIAREIGVTTQMGNERYSGYQKSDVRSQESVLSSGFFYPQLVQVDPGRLHRAPLSGKSIQ